MSRTVLIVDDEANVRLALRSRLSKVGCDVLEAGTLEDAKSMIAAHRDDLRVVILDLRLVAAQEEPGLESGLKLLKDELASERVCVRGGPPIFNPSTVVLVLTAYPDVRSCREAFLAGAMDYLDKNEPGVWDDLLEKVRSALAYSKEQTLFAARSWIEEHLDDILREYGGRTLALQGESIVEVAASPDELKELLKSRGLRPEDHLLVTVAEK
jgi:DNA-binding NtrC family response regulator